MGRALALPPADLVTASYVLGELDEADRTAVVDAAAHAAAGAVLLVEPGTPDGYRRIAAARDRLVAAGLRIVAPCPHGAVCPVEPGTDWCHFAARVGRSSLHRRVKGGSLPYEDEKFAYVGAVRFGVPAPAARVVRRPQLRKGQVILDLCTPADGLGRTTVTKRQGPAYRAARDAEWGGEWPPPAVRGEAAAPEEPAAPAKRAAPEEPAAPSGGPIRPRVLPDGPPSRGLPAVPARGGPAG
jgi:ribosomal protein RSM22 (predicted rRNA methylase)